MSTLHRILRSYSLDIIKEVVVGSYGSIDTDGDGIPDYLDEDDDNDGIDTRVERGQGDAVYDCDSDGVPDYLDADCLGTGEPPTDPPTNDTGCGGCASTGPLAPGFTLALVGLLAGVGRRRARQRHQGHHPLCR